MTTMPPSTRRRPATPGGRPSRARRAAVLLAVLLASLGQPALGSEHDRGGGEPEVVVSDERGTYRITARFTVAEPHTTVLAVLTDYDRIPSFMPDVRTSRVVDRTPTHLIVEQEAVARVMLFSRTIHLRLAVDQFPGILRFRDIGGRSFERYEGTWGISPGERGGSVITYTLTARPSFEVPGFLLKRLLRRDAREMIVRLKARIAAVPDASGG